MTADCWADRDALREGIARVVDSWAFSVVGNIMHTERASADREAALAKADSILTTTASSVGTQERSDGVHT